jgi:hypothetical protein
MNRERKIDKKVKVEEVKKEVEELRGGYCSLHPVIDINKKCELCYNTGLIRKLPRAVCKRLNWIGKIDHNIVGEVTENIRMRLKQMFK